jgi:hypothetical protein
MQHNGFDNRFDLPNLPRYNSGRDIGEMRLTVQFNGGMPNYCPPTEVAPYAGEILRAVPDEQIQENHFLSHAEMGKRCDKDECGSWGLSVWLSNEAAAHARAAFKKYFSKRFIVRVSVTEKDGRILKTPSNTQPEHHTFWKSSSAQFANRAQIVMKPEA